MSDIPVHEPIPSPARRTNRRLIWSVALTLTGYFAVAAFLYFDRNNGITTLIHSLGSSGVIGAIVVMAVVCMTPFPSEGLLIMYFKVYGIVFGLLYAWAGFTIGAVGVFFIARYLGSTVVRKYVSEAHFDSINQWIARKGVIGLLVVRLLPIPALITNCITGILPSVSVWNYIWTNVIGVIPYYMGILLIYLGLVRQSMLVFAAIPVLVGAGLIAYWLLRKRGLNA